jgi:6-pyruvoyl-tetrahydropterin synthase
MTEPIEVKPRVPTQYRRTFTLQSAHLNGQAAYDALEIALADRDFDALMDAFKEMHGHNFTVEVAVTGVMTEGFDYLVDDLELTRFLMQYENTNLSVVEPFGPKHRATTENLAEHFAESIWGMVGDNVTYVGVTVFETQDISASAGRGR